jgi:hypothetical protein
MATSLDIIKRALRINGAYGVGETLSSEEAQDSLTALNALMGSISNTPMVYAKTLDTISLTGGVSSITVGTSGTTVTPRPIKVLDESYITNGNVTYQLRIFTDKQYSDVMVKTTQAIPTAIWPLMNMPNVQITFWPVPIGGLTLYLWSTKLLQTFPDLTTTVSLPDGYEDYICYELADVLAPEFGTELSPTAKMRLRKLRHNIELTNLVVPMLKKPVDQRFGHYNVLNNGIV